MPVHDTLDSLIQRVLEEDARKFDLLADTRRMSVDAEHEKNQVLLNVDQPTGITTLKLSDHALGQISTDLEIPKRYFDRMKVDAPDLFQTNVHHWLYEQPKRKLVRAYQGEVGTSNGSTDIGRAWLSDRYRRLDNLEIATRLLPEFERLGTEVEFHNAAITDTKLYIRATFPAMEKAVKVGDIVRWGVQIKNSEVGDGQFDISNFALRLECINGMVVAKVMSARHVGKRLGENLSDEAIRADDKAFWLAARDELRAAISEERFSQTVRTLQKTTEGETITAPIAATERLASAVALTEDERDAVLVQLASGGDFSRWGALNAITAVAKTNESFDRQVELEEIGWNVAEMSEKQWSQIAVAA